MSKLLALSFDADASPRIRFQNAGAGAPGRKAAPRVYGWGVGWYPGSERGASVVKDPTSSGDPSVDQALGDWGRFRSTLFVCHLRGHRRKRSQEDAQPFVRSYGGRQWVFAHDGDLERDWSSRLDLGDDPAFEPLGRTDSEHAFCWLLSKLRERRARSLGDVEPSELLSWFAELDRAGQVNAMLADGEQLAVYRDGEERGHIYSRRRLPPHGSTVLESDDVRVELDDPEDPNRTALVFASDALSEDEWSPLSGGQLVLARRGSVVWDSHPAEAAAVSATTARAPAPQVRSEASYQTAAAQPLPAASPAVLPRERLLTVVHETHYSYQQPVERSGHRILMRPVSDALQQVESYSFEISPHAEYEEYEDVFGNTAIGVELTDPYSELSIVSRSQVRVRAPEPIESRSRRSRIPLVWMPWQRQMMSPYLLPAELPESQLEELSNFAMSFVERNDHDLIGSVLDMNETIYRDFEYVSGSTTVSTTPFEVLEARRGVCQDFAGLMICLSRLLNVPARYRMGYIFTGVDYENKVQSDASHAWAELYIPRLGWHGFDPTNGREVGADHVRVACGRNYRDATPTSGTIYRGGGMETLSIGVRVEAVEDPGPSLFQHQHQG